MGRKRGTGVKSSRWWGWRWRSKRLRRRLRWRLGRVGGDGIYTRRGQYKGR